MIKKISPCSPLNDKLRSRADHLGLYGLLAHWDEVQDEAWVERLVGFEEEQRHHRSLERRIRAAKIGRFKPMADFDWGWPKEIDRDVIDDLFSLEFIKEQSNVVLVGPSGLGKSTIAQNLAHQAVLKGYTARFVTASELLSDLGPPAKTVAAEQPPANFFSPASLRSDGPGRHHRNRWPACSGTSGRLGRNKHSGLP